MTFIAEMTKALAWPVALIALGVILKRHLSGLLEGVRLRRIKKGEWLADFETIAQEVRAELPGPGKNAAAPAVSEFFGEETKDLIDAAPAAAVAQTWNQIEGRVAAAAARAGVAGTLFSEVLRVLVNKGMIRPAVRDSILGLRNMRNLVVHAPSERLAPRQAREFITMAEATMWSLEEDLKRGAD